ncbi:hypothetical protein KJK32_30950 [Streptomyces sp. JCM17656]|nr:hypothetical protein KJK32_30950 [Streptomyces sp. JCM17656]
MSSIAFSSASQVHWSRYSYPATSDGERMITDRPASSTLLIASSQLITCMSRCFSTV